MDNNEQQQLREKLIELERKSAYFKNQVDELAASNIRFDAQLSSARMRLAQKEQAFHLLAHLQSVAGLARPIEQTVHSVLQVLHSKMNLSRSIIFLPSTSGFLAKFSLGYSISETQHIQSHPFPNCDLLHDSNALLLATLHERPSQASLIEQQYLTRLFIAVPMVHNDQVSGVLLASRAKEAEPFHHRLNSADGETLRSVASFLSITLDNQDLYTHLERKVEQRTAELQHHLLKEQLIRNISTRFVSVTNEGIEERLQESLSELGQFLVADRVRLLDCQGQALLSGADWLACPADTEPLANMQLWLTEPSATSEPHLPVLRTVLAAQGCCSALITPLLVGEDLLGFFSVEQHSIRPAWTADQADTALLVGQLLASVLWRRRLVQELRIQAETDPLTGANNRRSFLASFEREIRRAQHYQATLALLLVDLDHFKRVNDVYGHDAGDVVLKNFVNTCRSLLRDQDVLGRLGGEEFAVLMPETDLQGALAAAERLRLALNSYTFEINESRFQVTASIGVTEYIAENETIERCFKRADQALYCAKESGRNRVVPAVLE